MTAICSMTTKYGDRCRADATYNVETASGVHATCTLHLSNAVRHNLTHGGTAVVTETRSA